MPRGDNAARHATARASRAMRRTRGDSDCSVSGQDCSIMGLTSVRKRAGRRLLTGLDYHLLKVAEGRLIERIRDLR